jgi:hypothetical protein
LSGDLRYREVIERGWSFYRDRFFWGDEVPCYFPGKRFPVDATACAQSILTLCEFGDLSTADRVAEWTVAHMQNADGGFAYQVHRYFTNRIVYARWSVAWMAAALARLAAERAP